MNFKTMDSQNEISGWGGGRSGAGRKKSGRTTKTVRIDIEIADNLNQLIDIPDIARYWRAEADKQPNNPRFYYLKKFLDDMGY